MIFSSNSDFFAKKSLNRKNHYFVKITILVIFSSNKDFFAKKSLNEKITIEKITIFQLLKAFLFITNNSLLKNALEKTFNLFNFLMLESTSNHFSGEDSVVNTCVLFYFLLMAFDKQHIITILS